jgi:multiple sugar transport system permease protein
VTRRSSEGRIRGPLPPWRWVLRTVLLLGLLAVVLYPILWMVGMSFRSSTDVGSGLKILPDTWTSSNYREGWGSLRGLTFGRFFLNSAALSLAVVVGNTASCALAAYAFARLRFPARRLYFAVMIASLLLPSQVLIIPQYVLFKSFGWIDTPLPLLVPKILATEAFFVFLIVQFIRTVPRDLDEAAKMDGCTPYSLFLHVILPIARPALVTTAIFSFIWTWNDFLTQLVYLNDVSNYTVPVALRLLMDSSGQTALGPMFAMSVLSLLPVFLFFLAFQRMLVEDVKTDSIRIRRF